MFRIAFTPKALKHLGELRKYDHAKVMAVIKKQLPHQPTVKTTNRLKLRPNNLAEWELRIGELRVFYDVLLEDAIVKVVAIGYKEGNKVIISGQEYQL